VAAHEKRLRELSFAGAETAHDPSAPLALHTATVLPEWVDYNGHMTEFRYLHVFGDATDAFLTYLGMDAAYMAGGRSIYTVETHLRHVAEVREGRPLAVTTQLLGHDEKRIRIAHVMRDGETVLATAEHMLLSVNTAESRACPLAEPVTGRLAEVAAGHGALAAPDFAGRAIRAL